MLGHMGASEIAFLGRRLAALRLVYIGLTGGDPGMAIRMIAEGADSGVTLSSWLHLLLIPAYLLIGAVLWFGADNRSRNHAATSMSQNVSVGVSRFAGWLLTAFSGWHLLTLIDSPTVNSHLVAAIGPSLAFLLGIAILLKGRCAFMVPANGNVSPHELTHRP